MLVRFLYIFLLLISVPDRGVAGERDIKNLISEPELKCLSDVYTLVRKEDFEGALSVARFCNVAEIQKMIYWHILYRGYYVTAESLSEFLDEAKDFPDYDKLLKNYERNLSTDSSDDEVLLFFSDSYPKTKASYDLYQEAMKAKGKSDYAGNEIAKATISYFLSKGFEFSDFKGLKSQYPNVFTYDLIHKKISQLIWNKSYSAAKKYINYASKDHQRLFRTRLSFAKNYSRAPKYLKNVSKDLSVDEGLLYNIVKWLERRDKDSKVTKYFANIGKSDYALKWFPSRMRNARYLIKNDQYKKAYDIISNHGIVAGGYEYAESEWFSGWVALRFLHNPKIAAKHFHNVYDNVGFSISLSRASYWLGRAYSAWGKKASAEKWYNVASNYSTTYYGQMAILEMKQEVMINLPKFSVVEDGDLRSFLSDAELVKIGLYYAYLGDTKNAVKFLTYYIKNNKESDLQRLVVAVSSYTNDFVLINKIARYAARFNLITLENYPLVKNVKGDAKKSALIMSIIKQESGFNTGAVSRVGAVGFMQLMPPTAREMAKRMGIPFSKRKLRLDPNYNIKLGTYYMDHLLKRFDSSYILSIASYNAGPTNTKRWIKENGDPREFKDVHNVIDWVEKVTFSETRNYIQRIMETSVIYLHLIKQNRG